MTVHTRTKLFTLLLPLLLAACGGGGGGVVSQASAASSSASTPSSDPFHGIAVPPEPDAVANSTLLGVDSDNNGVRDDVDRKLAQMYGENPDHYYGALKVAKADQNFLIANGDVVKSTSATYKAASAGYCLYSKYNENNIQTTKEINKISPLTFNTLERMRAYRATISASREVSSSIPEVPCQ